MCPPRLHTTPRGTPGPFYFTFAGWHSPPSLLPIRMHASAPPPEAWRALFLETARKRKQPQDSATVTEEVARQLALIDSVRA